MRESSFDYLHCFLLKLTMIFCIILFAVNTVPIGFEFILCYSFLEDIYLNTSQAIHSISSLSTPTVSFLAHTPHLNHTKICSISIIPLFFPLACLRSWHCNQEVRHAGIHASWSFLLILFLDLVVIRSKKNSYSFHYPLVCFLRY